MKNKIFNLKPLNYLKKKKKSVKFLKGKENFSQTTIPFPY